MPSVGQRNRNSTRQNSTAPALNSTLCCFAFTVQHATVPNKTVTTHHITQPSLSNIQLCLYGTMQHETSPDPTLAKLHSAVPHHTQHNQYAAKQYIVAPYRHCTVHILTIPCHYIKACMLLHGRCQHI